MCLVSTPSSGKRRTRSTSIFVLSRQFLRELVLIMVLLLPVVGQTAGVPSGVQIDDNQLFIDGQAQPQLFGAELQYFRLRGGPGKNIPRAEVIALWQRALDHMVEAKMNTISFYIPWDFHEYKEGKFDFTGTVDEDGDGNPDYPSRDVLTFFKMVQEHGFKHILVRPGPYVNAEWGFLGFGAVPLWFHEKYPDSHMRNSAGLRTKLYDYHNPDFLRHTQLWFKALHEQVLSKFIGPGLPISFIQLDNETNFQWQSIYNHDYGAPAIQRYQEFLKQSYGTIEKLNAAHSRTWESFDEIKAPVSLGANLAEDQDWYRFQDESIHSYLHLVRTYWEALGVHEPDVMFTLAESYNVNGPGGLLPNYHFRDDPGVTGMMTVNLYPKVSSVPDNPLLNSPFKVDHDVKAADSAKEFYIGHPSEWAMGPEVQTGWWRGIEVSEDARRQTYLTVLGHGLKAMYVYYFNEGDNWQSDWARKQILPYYNHLKATTKYRGILPSKLPSVFWAKLQDIVDHKILVGFIARDVIEKDPDEEAELYFDAPLDRNAQPGKHFAALKQIGEKLIAPHQDFLGRAVETIDPVCLVKDVSMHVPSAIVNLDSGYMNADWSAGLLGYLLQAGVNPKIIHWGMNSLNELKACKLIVLQDNGESTPGLMPELAQLVREGHTVVTFIGDGLSNALSLNIPSTQLNLSGVVRANFGSNIFDIRTSPVFSYNLAQAPVCHPLLITGTMPVGYECQPYGPTAGNYVQIGAVFYDAFNSNYYADLKDVPARRSVLEHLLTMTGIEPMVQIRGGGDRLVTFGRRDPKGMAQWITVKNNQPAKVDFEITLQGLEAFKNYHIENLLSGQTQTLMGATIQQSGFSAGLLENESAVYYVQPAQE